ncbi:phosphate acyltransferase PlsX [candidate division KSB1 bacterium]|nr:phosphate acyltransferase PlsX [candidate division KSB1 bacterium]
MKIAVDAMGGDKAPRAIVNGAIAAARQAQKRYSVVLVGDETIIQQELSHHKGWNDLPIEIKHASQQVTMHDSPSVALKQKKDSSIAVAMRMHKAGEVNAIVSAGHTGAVLASALVDLRKIPGVIRPTIGSFIPNGRDVTLLMDAGTNVDCKPVHLLQFGLMGSIFFKRMIGRQAPVIGLLSIGEEKTKGNELVLRTHELLEQSKLNFIGNVEGGDILKGKVDIVVCDGFVGNIILKFAESFNRVYSTNLKKNIGTHLIYKLGALMLKPAFTKLKQTFDYAEYGGVPLLGVNGVAIICHGSSPGKAIMNAIFEAEKIINTDVNRYIAEELKTFSEEKFDVSV